MRTGSLVAPFAIAMLLPSVASPQRSLPFAAAVGHVADSLAESVLRTGAVAGLSIAVLRGNDTLVMKGYGSADLENDRRRREPCTASDP